MKFLLQTSPHSPYLPFCILILCASARIMILKQRSSYITYQTKILWWVVPLTKEQNSQYSLYGTSWFDPNLPFRLISWTPSQPLWDVISWETMHALCSCLALPGLPICHLLSQARWYPFFKCHLPCIFPLPLSSASETHHPFWTQHALFILLLWHMSVSSKRQQTPWGCRGHNLSIFVSPVLFFFF